MEKPATILAEAMLTDDQLKAVGCLALEANHLEIYIDQLVIQFCGENVGKLLLQRKMLDSKVDLLKDLFLPEINNQVLQDRFTNLYERIKSDIPKRNAAIHGDWGLNRQIPLVDLFKSKNNEGASAIYKSLSIKAADVMEIAHRFARYQGEILDFAVLIGASVTDVSSPDKCE